LLVSTLVAQQPQVVHQDVLSGVGYHDWFRDLEFSSSGDLFALGESHANFSGVGRTLLVRYDRHGVRAWTASYDPSAGGTSLAPAFVASTQDDGCVVLAGTGSLYDYEIAKFGAAGQLEWQLLAPDPSGQFAAPGDMLVDPAGRTWIGGQRYTSGPNPPRGRITIVEADGTLALDHLYPTNEFTGIRELALGLRASCSRSAVRAWASISFRSRVVSRAWIRWATCCGERS
jgi:hypothetical protein